MDKYTPGPWRYDKDTGYISAYIAALEDDDCIAIIPNIHRWTDGSHVYKNAQLIAAAPELLEALKNLIEIQVQYDNGFPTPETIAAGKAIAKAEGRA